MSQLLAMTWMLMLLTSPLSQSPYLLPPQHQAEPAWMGSSPSQGVQVLDREGLHHAYHTHPQDIIIPGMITGVILTIHKYIPMQGL